jgi:ABC-type transport system involved in multi-copper enzyme maturation permease subunit
MERRALFGVALVIGILPLLTSQLKSLGVMSGSNDIGTITGMLLIIFTMGVSLLIGSSVLGRDFSERRMGFFFARPISGFSIWAGKFLGAYALLLGSSLALTLPTLLFYGFGGDLKKILANPEDLGAYLLLTLFFLSIGMVIGVIFRSKSWMLALDLALVPLSIFFAISIAERVIFAFIGYRSFMHLDDIFFYGMGVLVIVAFLCASVAGVVFGRTDIRRAHRMMSMTFWSIALIGLLGYDGFSRWVVAASPNDITSIDYGVMAAPQGNWALVSGKAWGRGEYHPFFLMDTASGRYFRLTPFVDMAFSGDGKRAAWLHFTGSLFGSHYDLVTLKLDDPNAQPVTTKISFPENGYGLVLSQDGSKIAVINSKMVTVFELPSEKEVATTYLPNGTDINWNKKAFFISPDLLRVYWGHSNGDPAHLQAEIIDFDLNTKKTETRGHMDTERGMLIPSPDGNLLLMQNFFGNHNFVYLFDGREGKLIAKLASSDENNPSNNAKETYNGSFLANGKIAVAEAVNGKASIHIFSSAGVEEKAIAIGDGRYVSCAGETSAGHLIVCVSGSDNYSRKGRLYLVDPATGAATEKASDISPINVFSYFFSLYPGGVKPGSEATKLFQVSNNSLVHLDLETGERHNVEFNR